MALAATPALFPSPAGPQAPAPSRRLSGLSVTLSVTSPGHRLSYTRSFGVAKSH